MAEMKFVDLVADNLFDCCALVNAIGVQEITDIFNQKEIMTMVKKSKDANEIGTVVGMKIAGIVIKSLPTARNEIYTFLANCVVWDNGSAVSVDDIKKLSLNAFVALIKEFFQREDLADFFKDVAELLGLAQTNSQTLSIVGTATQADT